MSANLAVHVDVFEGAPLQRYLFRGRECWIAAEVGRVLDYGKIGAHLVEVIRKQWTREMREGQDFEILTGERLREFKALVELTEGTSVSRAPHVMILYESGLHFVCIKTEKPLGSKLRLFLVDHIMPKLRRGLPIGVTPTPEPVVKQVADVEQRVSALEQGMTALVAMLHERLPKRREPANPNPPRRGKRKRARRAAVMVGEPLGHVSAAPPDAPHVVCKDGYYRAHGRTGRGAFPCATVEVRMLTVAEVAATYDGRPQARAEALAALTDEQRDALCPQVCPGCGGNHSTNAANLVRAWRNIAREARPLCASLPIEPYLKIAAIRGRTDTETARRQIEAAAKAAEMPAPPKLPPPRTTKGMPALPSAPHPNAEHVRAALVETGYKPAQAAHAVAALGEEINKHPLPELVRRALAFLSRHR